MPPRRTTGTKRMIDKETESSARVRPAARRLRPNARRPCDAESAAAGQRLALRLPKSGSLESDAAAKPRTIRLSLDIKHRVDDARFGGLLAGRTPSSWIMRHGP